MSTRAQIAIQIGPEEWAHVYVHFDGYPAHMLPALARWKPEDILIAREIRQVTAEALDCFSPPRDPVSYTHLDVYKRQVIRRPRPAATVSAKRLRMLSISDRMRARTGSGKDA